MKKSTWLLACLLSLCLPARATETTSPSRPAPPAGVSRVDSAESPDPNIRPTVSSLEAQGARSTAAGTTSEARPRELSPEQLERKKDRLVAKIAKLKCPKGSADGDVDTDAVIERFEKKHPTLMSDRDFADEIQEAIEQRIEVCIATGGRDPQRQQQMDPSMMMAMQGSMGGFMGQQSTYPSLSGVNMPGSSPSFPYQSALTSSFSPPWSDSYMNSLYRPRY